ncbi:MAG TPA: NUDIX hydrolase [Candidatus Paceibacterota bacterium]|nr:NUDIX hydrolase [Candidatus Paceibacterota bacterium]
MDKVKIVCRALIIDNQNRILLVKKNSSDFWSLPGGKLEIDDISLQECLVRELKEELGVDTIISNIRFVKELHKNDTRYVELIWETTITSNPAFTSENIYKISNGELIDIQWIKKGDLNNIEVKPEFLKNII